MKIYYYAPTNSLLQCDDELVPELDEKSFDEKVKGLADVVYTPEEFEKAFNAEQISNLGMIKIFND